MRTRICLCNLRVHPILQPFRATHNTEQVDFGVSLKMNTVSWSTLMAEGRHLICGTAGVGMERADDPRKRSTAELSAQFQVHACQFSSAPLCLF
jgi:hypothetical protein